MTDRVARLRIRSVRMKNGGASVRVLPGDDRDYAELVRKGVERCIRGQAGDIAGFAICIWGKTNDSCADAASWHTAIPAILIPDFVRNRLLAERIVDWAIEEINQT